MDLFKNKNVLVTGAAGLCGTATIKKLLQLNSCNVIGTTYNRRTLDVVHDKLEVVKLDLMSYDNCNNIMKDIDIVIHCAAFSGGAGLQDEYQIDLFRNNAVMSSNLISSAVNASISLIETLSIVLSSAVEYKLIAFKFFIYPFGCVFHIGCSAIVNSPLSLVMSQN